MLYINFVTCVRLRSSYSTRDLFVSVRAALFEIPHFRVAPATLHSSTLVFLRTYCRIGAI